MTLCPWFPHDVDPDPAELELPTGAVGMCMVCSLKYVVKKTKPNYVLARDVEGSAATIFALSRTALAKDFKPLLKVKGVTKTLTTLGVPKKQLQ
jgi:hypothetical protein